MAEPAVPDAGVGSAVVNGARATGTFIKDAAVAAVKSVRNDASTFVAEDATLGARAEAGLNIAADVASVATGPEDIAAERAVVFAVKEGVEHAPQLAEGAPALGKIAVREAPEITKSATVVFDRAASIIKAAGHELIDSQPGRGILETEHAIYSVAEGAEANLGQVGELFNKAWHEGKNFAIHGPNLENRAVNEIEKYGYESIGKKQGIEAVISRSDYNLEHALGDLEKSHAVQHALTKSKEVVKGVTGALETTGKVGEFAKKGLEFAGYGGAAAIVAEHAGHVGHNVVDAAKAAVHRVETATGQAKQHVAELAGHAAVAASAEVGHATAEAEELAHGAKHGIETTGKALEQAANGVADRIHHWTPEMPLEDFHKIIATIRGGTPATAHSQEPPSQNRQPKHDRGLGH